MHPGKAIRPLQCSALGSEPKPSSPYTAILRSNRVAIFMHDATLTHYHFAFITPEDEQYSFFGTYRFMISRTCSQAYYIDMDHLNLLINNRNILCLITGDLCLMLYHLA